MLRSAEVVTCENSELDKSYLANNESCLKCTDFDNPLPTSMTLVLTI